MIQKRTPTQIWLSMGWQACIRWIPCTSATNIEQPSRLSCNDTSTVSKWAHSRPIRLRSCKTWPSCKTLARLSTLWSREVGLTPTYSAVSMLIDIKHSQSWLRPVHWGRYCLVTEPKEQWAPFLSSAGLDPSAASLIRGLYVGQQTWGGQWQPSNGACQQQVTGQAKDSRRAKSSKTSTSKQAWEMAPMVTSFDCLVLALQIYQLCNELNNNQTIIQNNFKSDLWSRMDLNNQELCKLILISFVPNLRSAIYHLVLAYGRT